MYGFQRVHRGRDEGGYMHKLFVKDRPELAHEIRRTVDGRAAVQGTAASSSDVQASETGDDSEADQKKPASK
jgi:hypothetical protein